MNAQELRTRDRTENEPADDRPGVLPSQGLQTAINERWVSASPFFVPEQNIQPASLDLRLGTEAWRLQCSFLPDSKSTVFERAEDLKLDDRFRIVGGATLERNRPYLIPLAEELALPDYLRGKANPKSSTGRLDVFTRVITDFHTRFDEIPAGYRGKLYLEVVPRSFAVRVEERLSLNQLRLASGNARVPDEELRAIHRNSPLLYVDDKPLPAEALRLADGLFLSVDLVGNDEGIVGYRARKNSRRVDMAKIKAYNWREFWEPVYADRGRVILEPEEFYLLISKEGVCVPPQYAAEMTAYDPTAGELRTHYAGFFDPGFGYDRARPVAGSRAALEVRARDVPFMLEDGQLICKLAYEQMLAEPDRLYGSDVGSNYQGQASMLGKHFTDKTLF